MFNITKLNILWDKVKALEAGGGGGGLPEVDTSDVGKVLTVGDTGEWEADDLPPQLPEVDQSDYGAYLSVDENGEWGLSTPTGGYSTVTGTPVKTGNTIYSFDEYILAVNTPSQYSVISPQLPIHGISEVYGNIIGAVSTRKIDLSENIGFNATSPTYPGDAFVWISDKYVANVNNLIIKFY